MNQRRRRKAVRRGNRQSMASAACTPQQSPTLPLKKAITIHTASFAPSTNKMQGLYGHSMCVSHDTGTLFVYGGWMQNGFQSNSLRSLDLRQLNHRAPLPVRGQSYRVEWKTVKQRGRPRPTPCSFASMVERHGYLILFGGYTRRQWVNEMWSFEIATGRWWKMKHSGDLSIPPRAAHACVLSRNKSTMFVQGGFDGTKMLSDLWSYSFATHAWTQLPSLNSLCKVPPTSGHSLVLSWDEERLIKFGGWDRVQHYDTLYEYDLRHKEWNQIRPRASSVAPSARWRHVSFLIKSTTTHHDQVLVLFGTGDEKCRDSCLFDCETKTWKSIHLDPPLPASDSMAYAMTWNSKMLVFGGRRPYLNNLALTELTMTDAAPIVMHFQAMFSPSHYARLMVKQFAVDVEIFILDA